MTIESRTHYQDPEHRPPLKEAIPLGLQHVLAMFAGNVTVPILIAGAAGIAGGDKVFLIQAAMLVSGIATLIQSIGVGPLGARLPLVMGTNVAFVPIMIPMVRESGLALLFGVTVVGGIFHFLLGTQIGKLRRFISPLVSGVVVLTMGLALIPVGISYAAGGAQGAPDFGAAGHWLLAVLVILTTVGFGFFTRGFTSISSVLIGLVVGYLAAIPMGVVDTTVITDATWFALPQPLKYGLDINVAAALGMCLMAVVSTVETVGDISAITKGGANREATEREISGGTMADGLGTVIAGIFGSMPNTSYSQNVGLVALTGVMSRYVVSIGAVFLVIAGLVPKVGAVVAAMPDSVLGGAAIIMFGMIASAGLRLLSEVRMNRRNMAVIAMSLGVGLGLQAVPDALPFITGHAKILLTSGILPVAFLAIVLDGVLPERE